MTNRDFKRFVDAGGYRDRKYWQHPFVDGGRTLTFEQAMARFRDSTDQPGPATWESGNFLEGQDDLPVTGVSWYEAAAFAAFSGKSLPTIFHWSRVADQRMSGSVVAAQQFSEPRPHEGWGERRHESLRRVRPGWQRQGMVLEQRERRQALHLGGGWDEPAYMFNDPDARSPFERAANFGFRWVKYADDDVVAKRGRTGGIRGARLLSRAARH